MTWNFDDYGVRGPRFLDPQAEDGHTRKQGEGTWLKSHEEKGFFSVPQLSLSPL